MSIDKTKGLAELLLLLEKFGIKGIVDGDIIKLYNMDEGATSAEIEQISNSEVTIEDFLALDNYSFELPGKEVFIQTKRVNKDGKDYLVLKNIEIYYGKTRWGINMPEYQEDSIEVIVSTIDGDEYVDSIEIAAYENNVDLKISNQWYYFVDGKYSEENEVSKEQMMEVLVKKDTILKMLKKLIDISRFYYKNYYKELVRTVEDFEDDLFQNIVVYNKKLYQKEIAKIKKIDPDWEVLPSVEKVISWYTRNLHWSPLMLDRYITLLRKGIMKYLSQGKDFLIFKQNDANNYIVDPEMERPEIPNFHLAVSVRADETIIYDYINEYKENMPSNNDNIEGMFSLLEKFSLKALRNGDIITFVNIKNESLPVTINGKKEISIRELNAEQLLSFSTEETKIRIKLFRKESNGNNIISNIEYEIDNNNYSINLLNEDLLIRSCKKNAKSDEKPTIITVEKEGFHFYIRNMSAIYLYSPKKIGQFEVLKTNYDVDLTRSEVRQVMDDHEKIIRDCVSYYGSYFPNMARTVDYYVNNKDRESLHEYVITNAKKIFSIVNQFVKKNTGSDSTYYEYLFLKAKTEAEEDIVFAFTGFEKYKMTIYKYDAMTDKITYLMEFAMKNETDIRQITMFVEPLPFHAVLRESIRDSYTKDQEKEAKDIIKLVNDSLGSLKYDWEQTYMVNNYRSDGYDDEKRNVSLAYYKDLYNYRIAELKKINPEAKVLPVAQKIADWVIGKLNISKEKKEFVRGKMQTAAMKCFKDGKRLSYDWLNEWQLSKLEPNEIKEVLKLTSRIEGNIDKVRVLDGDFITIYEHPELELRTAYPIKR